MPTPPILRTPEERFASLPGYSYAPHYLNDLKGFEGMRLPCVDETGARRPPTRRRSFASSAS